MGYNARNDEIRDNITKMRAQWRDERLALVPIQRRQRQGLVLAQD